MPLRSSSPLSSVESMCSPCCDELDNLKADLGNGFSLRENPVSAGKSWPSQPQSLSSHDQTCRHSSTDLGSPPQSSLPSDHSVSMRCPVTSSLFPAPFKTRTSSPLASQGHQNINSCLDASRSSEDIRTNSVKTSLSSLTPIELSLSSASLINSDRSVNCPPLMTTLTNPRPDIQTVNTTRSRAMDSLTEAIQRRLSQEAIPSRPKFVLAGGLINPRRDERKALGLRAAVGSYKKKAASLSDKSESDSSSSSPSNSPPHEQLHHIINKPEGLKSELKIPLNTAPIRHLSESYSSAQSPINYSQYLAERRESIMRRGGRHRRVASETLLRRASGCHSLSSSHQVSLAPQPTATALPSLDQIRNWAAQRRSSAGSGPKNPLELPSLVHCASNTSVKSLPDVKPLELNKNDSSSAKLRKRKSLRIYSHARDPSIPQICLSPDSDDDTDIETDEEPESALSLSHEASTEDIDAPLSELNLQNNFMPIGAFLKAAHIARHPPDVKLPSAPRQSTNKDNADRAEQRQFLLKNLAQAQQRRSGQQIYGSGIVVAPV
ncbi:hypothetical protein BY996DRAFT_6409169 [Phakopsora pachyrhizi]|uniref:Expressed protein n=1 Tax=Phakopsora pachyrhizi TaxID=170000 RepID=A0AAV0B121_PHAPC|nr:hypothetical protein BY996DRAFT_6409169 [Phakopsora pachyrhizi]CAH7675459.1 expressed protein [Phakopsora pachyrhizi]